MLSFVIADSAEASLCLLHDIGVCSLLRERDLSEALGLIIVRLHDRDFTLFRHRLVRRGICSLADRERERIIIRPVSAVQYLLYLHLAFPSRRIGVRDRLGLDQLCIFLGYELALAVVNHFDRHGMLSFVIADSAEASLCLLHGVGIGARLREFDLSEALCLVLITLLDRDAGLCRHRYCLYAHRRRLPGQRERERIRIRPVAAFQHLLHLDFTFAGCRIGVRNLQALVALVIVDFST